MHSKTKENKSLGISKKSKNEGHSNPSETARQNDKVGQAQAGKSTRKPIFE